ncbi:MAG: hypothetical protein ABH836_03945 [Candidatus Omnitrophota bacterium]
MKTLLYVPVIHTSGDLGSVATEVAKRGISRLGIKIWEEHDRTVEKFWDVLSRYFETQNVSGVKIYQDGMIAEGEIARKIVEDGVKAGSSNYRLISKLLERGAFLVKTENFSLVKEERDRILALIHAKSFIRKLAALVKYKVVKNKLLKKRDKFIANRIDETLKHGEKAILFIGALHNIKEKLPNSFQVIEIKNISGIREYQRLFPFYPKFKKRIEELQKYLISKVEGV